MNVKSFQHVEKEIIIGLEEQSEIKCLVQKYIREKFGYSRINISSFELMKNKPQAQINLEFSSSLITLYLRFGRYGFAVYKEKKYIVVASIGFRNKKNGYGTALLKELCIFGEKFGYEYLEVECPNPDCQVFMKKLGFKDDFFLPIKQLKKSIRDYELLKQA